MENGRGHHEETPRNSTEGGLSDGKKKERGEVQMEPVERGSELETLQVEDPALLWAVFFGLWFIIAILDLRFFMLQFHISP